MLRRTVGVGPLGHTHNMFQFFENLIDPLAQHDVVRPPQTVKGFILHFLFPFRYLLALTLVLTGISAVTDLLLYTFLAKIVDWMTVTPAEAFWESHGMALLGMFAVVAIARPVFLISSRALINLAITPGLANTVRWRNHRYVLRQSLHYFYGDFAGRISQKVMQTGVALGGMLLNLLDGLWFLLIYLVGVFVLFTQINAQLLMPVLVWMAAYLWVVVSMVPPVRQRSADVSEATSGLTGRLVDSYTNILSVKLFAHSDREERFAAEAVDRLTRSTQFMMRAVLKMTATLSVLNASLIVSMAGLSIYLWQQGRISVGEIAMVNGLIIRLNQMSGWILRTITALFESIGTLQNGIDTISQPNLLPDKPRAGKLDVRRGEVTFDAVSFGYHGQSGSAIDAVSLNIQPGEKVGLVG
ncbi:MAG TPA: multidrug ABC transporter ATP-binding protein, partial [Gammaproteobacteria bacterium]|nr:multidrug ABC transporter ATP-binding protein [Gammaproteobacteria bacterium]